MSSIRFSPAGPDAKAHVEVTAEDQQMINCFARYNIKTEELKEQLTDLNRHIENIKEACDELIFVDDDDEDDLGDDDQNGVKPSSNFHFQIGNSFMAVNKTELEQLLEQKKSEIEKKIAGKRERSIQLKEEMEQLKLKLYAKFGNNINLDSDPEPNRT